MITKNFVEWSKKISLMKTDELDREIDGIKTQIEIEEKYLGQAYFDTVMYSRLLCEKKYL